MRFFNAFSLSTWRGDLAGGVTAAIVALPLALAFGVASGAGAMAGLYGAIGVGFFAALFGGTPSQVSGPTGPMTVVFAAVIAQYAHNLPEAFTIVMLGGLFQILFGLARLGRYVQYTPVSVVSGFMTGIGVIIILLQTGPFVGASPASGPLEAIAAAPALVGAFSPRTALVGAIALAAMVFWPKPLHRFAPPPLVALALATLAAVLIAPDAARIGAIPQGLPALVTPTIPLIDLPSVLQAALVLALLGSIDSLLTSLVADSLSRTRHDSNRELVGQGIGNVVAGILGGLPGAGATMRTVVNLRAGGVSAASGMIHAVVLLAVALGLGRLAGQIPLAALAGILMKVGWDIIDWGYLRRLARLPREKAVVMLTTFILTVGVDLITAVGVGLIMAGFVAARAREADEIAGVETADRDDGAYLSEDERALLAASQRRVRVTRLAGALSFASARQLQRRITGGDGEALVLDLSALRRADLSASLAIEEILASAVAGGGDVYVVVGASAPALDRLGVLQRIGEDRRFADRRAAIEAAATWTAA